MRAHAVLSLVVALIVLSGSAVDAGLPSYGGLTFATIPAGSYIQGYSETPLPANLTRDLSSRTYGDYDEQPYQRVDVPTFSMSTTEVTNAVYEQYDPSHKAWRGHQGWSTGDNEAAVFVTWQDAYDFTEWLSQKLDMPFRLPFEDEWEYACRGGTTTYFNTGNDFPYGKNQGVSWYPGRMTLNTSVVVNLTVADFPPNQYGLHDMHGNVEEFCADEWAFYGNPGRPSTQDNLYRVTRGGSHSTELYYLRSANRLGVLPTDKSWYIGFRVVLDLQFDGTTGALEAAVARRAAARAAQAAATPAEAAVAPAVQPAPQARKPATAAGGGRPPVKRVSDTEPIFMRPLKYVQVDSAYHLPFDHHNHDPALVICPNNDVLATWFSTIEEPGRESGIVTARLKAGEDSWPLPTVFANTPDRCEMAPDMWLDPESGLLHHFHGVSAAATWGNLAVSMRVSSDCGETLILPEHALRHQPVNTAFRCLDGAIVLPCDNVTIGSGGTAVHKSYDNGTTWSLDPATGENDILGIHGTLAQLTNGTLQAFGRGNDINGMMARSLSDNMGKTWRYSASVFPGIGGGQRGIQLRLSEGPLMFCSFATDPMLIDTVCGTPRNVTGLYCALSDDEGTTWYRRRLVSDDGAGSWHETLDGVLFLMSFSTAEPHGYSTARQGPDGLIHLITSRQHYRFNLAWLQQQAPCAP